MNAYDMDKREIKYLHNMRKEYLENIILVYKKPDWFEWFNMYPAKSMVGSAATELSFIKKIEQLN